MTNVIVTIVGTQRDAQGEADSIELITAGRWYDKNGVRYIIYEDTEISGMEGTKTMLKLQGERVVLVRTGKVEHRQEFCLGEKSVSPYLTPYGTMEMGIDTRQLKVVLAEAGGSLYIEYDLEINGQWQSTNTLSVKVREESKRGY